MLQVILDTNILDRSPNRSSAEFHALQNLCDTRKIQLHLSDVVQREFLSHREEAIEEGVRLISRGFRKLSKEKVADQSQFSEFLSWKSRLEKLESEFLDETHKEFSQWVESLNIEIHKVAPHHGEATVDAYFKGQAPFKGNRSKTEFADAFIWQTLLDILGRHKNVHFISNNTKDFLKICEQTAGVTLYHSLEEFLISPRIKDIFLGQFTEQNFEAILTILQQKEADILPVLIRETSKAFDPFDYYLLKDLVDPAAEITGWGHSSEKDWKVKVQYDQARHYGYGIVSLPIVVRIKEFNLGYARTIYDVPQPMPPNTEVRSIFKSGEAASFYTDDYFPLLLHTSAEVNLFTGATDDLALENIPEMIKHAPISVSQIDYVEADETKREVYNTIL